MKVETRFFFRCEVQRSPSRKSIVLREGPRKPKGSRADVARKAEEGAEKNKEYTARRTEKRDNKCKNYVLSAPNHRQGLCGR